MIDIHKETLVTLSEAAALLPDRPHVSTLHRWRMNGVHGVKLETVWIGRKCYTSHEKLSLFIQASSAAADGAGITPALGDNQKRRLEKAKRELAAAGI